jgi:hypothetical protein
MAALGSVYGSASAPDGASRPTVVAVGRPDQVTAQHPVSVMPGQDERYVAPMDDEELLEALKTGPLHPFADFHEIEDLPRTGAGVYTIWSGDGQLVYVGIAGRNITGKGLHGRLKSHYQGRRSGDQFCVYVSDRYVLPQLTEQERNAVGAGELSMDQKIRDYVRAHLAFRYVEVGDYSTAMRVENAVKRGALGHAPDLNP